MVTCDPLHENYLCRSAEVRLKIVTRMSVCYNPLSTRLRSFCAALKILLLEKYDSNNVHQNVLHFLFYRFKLA